MIDYSDFQGKKRPFPPTEPDEEMDTEYESFLRFHETYRNDYRDITEYDYNLGFVFAVNDRGFHLEMLGESMDTAHRHITNMSVGLISRSTSTAERRIFRSQECRQKR